MVGQIYLPANSRVSRFSFLLCEDFSASAGIYALIEFLSYQAGENQALNLVAEVENNPGLFEMLRRAGFSAFGIETVWKLAERFDKPGLSSSWKNAIDKDEIGIRSLYQAVTPPLEQGAELYQPNCQHRMVHSSKSEINGWAQYKSGPLGTYINLVLHPSLNDPEALLGELSGSIYSQGRPVYLRIRSHQSWLNSALEKSGALVTGEYTLMVKHLAVSQKSVVANGTLARVEARQAKPTVPIVRNLVGEVPPIEPKNGLK